MKVHTVVEDANGQFEFKATLSPQQHAFLIEYAIRDLVRKGLVPFIDVNDDKDLINVIPQPTENSLQ